MYELIGGAGGLGWVVLKAMLLFAVAVIGLRLGERWSAARASETLSTGTSLTPTGTGQRSPTR
jgi:hypothetical protein